MALIVNARHPSGLSMPAAYHRIRRLVLDPEMKAATVEMMVYYNREARAAGAPPLPTPLSFVCQNQQSAAVEDGSVEGGYRMSSPSLEFEKWFSPDALSASNRDPYAQAYLYLKANVPLYANAEDHLVS